MFRLAHSNPCGLATFHTMCSVRFIIEDSNNVYKPELRQRHSEETKISISSSFSGRIVGDPEVVQKRASGKWDASQVVAVLGPKSRSFALRDSSPVKSTTLGVGHRFRTLPL